MTSVSYTHLDVYKRQVYDYISFDEDHKNVLYEYKGDYESLKSAEGKVVLWSWPGSGKVKGTVDESEIPEYDPQFSHAYKDNQGREWLYTCLLYTSRCV